MRFSIIIPTAKKDSRYLKRALLSILDQDFKDYEVVVVADGFECKLPVNDKCISVYSLGHQSGAPKARNFGAEQSKGEILFFFDVDCSLFPGMLTLINDRFNQHDTDFVYSGYRFNHSTLSVYPSRPFEPYLIESMNYISSMSPMKRNVFFKVGGFREDLPYFQDWDFFIRAIKDYGFKGHYLKDFIFQTEVPNFMSISGEAKHTWREKIEKIESINNIKKRNLCVTTLAAPYQSIERAKALDARFIGKHNGSSLCQLPSQFDFDIKAVILQGFFPEAAEEHMKVFPAGCLKVINWIGTDVWQMIHKFNWENLQFIKKNYLSQIDLQFCNSQVLQEELRELGIEAEVVYQPLTEEIVATPLPKKPVVSAYCSPGHPLHNEFFIKDLAFSMPDIDFMFFGTDLADVQDKNIRYMGFIPIQQAVDMSTMHIRLTQHDGFPHTPIYFAMAGRRVLSKYNLKYCDHIEDVPHEATWDKMKRSIIAYIRENLNKPINHKVDDCVAHYRILCSKYGYASIMHDRIDKALKEKNDKSLVDTSNV